MQGHNDNMIERFTVGRRLTHWINAGAFFVLLITGLFLMLPALAPFAESGLSRTLHRIFAVVLMLVPIIFLILDRKGLLDFVRESLKIDVKADMGFHIRMPLYILGIAKGIPPQGKNNAGQKAHHLAIAGLYLAIGVSGFVLWLGKGTLGASTFALMILLHNIAVFALVLLTVMHIYFTLVYGALPAMLNGKVSENYIKFEHRKWWEELQEEKKQQGSRSVGS